MTNARDQLLAAVFELSCDDQFKLATRIAANVGYVLTDEPQIDRVHPQAQQPFIWICLVQGKWGENIRAWTRDPDQAARFIESGMEVQPLYATPPRPPEAGREAIAISEILEEEVYFNKDTRLYDYGDAVERLLSLRPADPVSVGPYEVFAGYMDLGEPLAGALVTLEAFITNAEEENDPEIEKEVHAFNIIVEGLRVITTPPREIRDKMEAFLKYCDWFYEKLLLHPEIEQRLEGVGLFKLHVNNLRTALATKPAQDE